MASIQFLLYPEWQGYGSMPSVHHGALAVARSLFPDAVIRLHRVAG